MQQDRVDGSIGEMAYSPELPQNVAAGLFGNEVTEDNFGSAS